MSFEVMFEGVK